MPLPILLGALLWGAAGALIGGAIGTVIDMLLDDEVYLAANDWLRERNATLHKAFLLLTRTRTGVRRMLKIATQADPSQRQIAYQDDGEVSFADLPEDARKLKEGQQHEEEVTREVLAHIH